MATKNLKPEKSAVLFVCASQNYISINGIRLPSEAYSAYPVEKEVLMREAFHAFVLAIERDVKIMVPPGVGKN